MMVIGSYKFRSLLWLICTLLLAVGCRSETEAQQQSIARRDGRIMVWHSWGDEGTLLLESLVEQYRAVHPDATIVVVALSSDEIYDRFINTASLGLGPDLIIGSNEWLAPLVEQGVINQITPESIDTANFYTASINLSSINGVLYAIPIALRTPALYYNRMLSTETPSTYDALLAQAQDGKRVAISASAQDAFGGISAFGSPLLNDEEGVLRLDLTGFEQWLTWLKEAQEDPNVVMSQDEPSLIRLFSRGEVAYFVGSYEVRKTLLDMETAAQNEEENAPPVEFELGIAPLPRGPERSSMPALEAELIFFNSASSQRQRRLALAFADFITNSEQSSNFLRDLNIVPANRNVRVNRVIYPLVQPYTQSGRNALALPLSLEPYLIGNEADVVYTAVLSGVSEPRDAICEWYAVVAAAFPQQVDDAGYCPGDP